MGWAEYDLGGPCFGIERVDEDEQSVKRFDLFPDISIGDAPVSEGGA